MEISDEKGDFLGEITAMTGNVTTATKGKACRNPRDGNPEQKICKQLNTETEVVLYLTRAVSRVTTFPI